MRIAVASDHAGFDLKAVVIEHLTTAGHTPIDVGTYSTEPVDYPGFCASAARAVVRDEADAAVVIGGSGQGEQIAANKVHGARAALCHDEFTARLSRQHNNANVLALGARILAPQLALVVLDEWLATDFEGGRHVARIEQLADIEREECANAGG
ncbi:MAG: ribose 5-phosphate isomerase [Acidimicrobiaceae bacterium]|jgi:ribose 5-phosphate isomerase B|nr:ribose 5-phosphate isomerase [Acidimicrobiaceae bacterium]MDQ1367066.1 ribose 5-phosphate isomerase [Acidimicrobiaceae bacterium]MDQ1370362.1 ribose 5-phosphate isomerase [Acidimicrobiaceae bacterium]MDQ1376190.1 ribose 5-phosphate isomerase [Acidimicrobiaceae bacterium]MDQ1412243.1 ribose 5-phosphate isomerase [Acidimicrobiaceae bacterium]